MQPETKYRQNYGKINPSKRIDTLATETVAKWQNLVKEGDSWYFVKRIKKTDEPIHHPVPKIAMSYLPEREGTDASAQIFDLPRKTTVNSDIKRWAAKAGVEKNLCYHCLSHNRIFY